MVLSHRSIWRRVTGTPTRHYEGDLVRLRTDNGSVLLTPNHPVWTGIGAEWGWDRVEDIQEGDRVRLPEIRRDASVRSLSRAHCSGPVYNLHVEEDESFTAEGIAVHNCWIAKEGIRNALKRRKARQIKFSVGAS